MMSLRAALQTRQRGHESHWFVVAILAILIGFLVWSRYAELDQISRAQGQIIASARTQIIQAANDGVIESIFVSDGGRVTKGQKLVLLERNQAEAAYQDSLGKVAALKANQIRLESEVFDRPLMFTDDIKKYPTFVSNQTALYLRRQEALGAEINNLKMSLGLVNQELDLSRPLLKMGDIGRLEIIRLQKQIAEINGKITNRRNQFFEDALAKMTKTEEELTTQEQILAEREVALERTVIKAPADGLVRKILITTPGARVRPGEVILELLPTGGKLVFEAKLRPADVAFVKSGLKSSVKLDAYDASIYGGLDGAVSYISPDALSEKTNRGDEIFYNVQITIDLASMEAHNREKPDRIIVIQPGMTGTVEIKTGRKSVWSYLSKPVTKTMSEALTER